ncbi:hypothetical protein C451_15643 [Halococcus thailandensis JCM 13552]|uniref:Uncharacterized protein n=1 Tax=Halococcus thailandensis JCM 13552 TaxID=1227457 RepID=M0MZV8_9EURY|nr:hypothetical protein C451_15643 [Halococcus thailandensis JCM 13552]
MLVRQSTRSRLDDHFEATFWLAAVAGINLSLYDRQNARVKSTSTGTISMRPIHISIVMTSFVATGKPA